MRAEERLHMALLLAGVRASLEKQPVYVEQTATGFGLSSNSRPGAGAYIRVSSDGRMESYAHRRDRSPRALGKVVDLVS